MPAATNQACCVFDEPLRVTTKFAFYALLSAREHLIVQSSGGGQPNINQEKLRALRLAVPPLGEQLAIVDYLDKRTMEIDNLASRAHEAVVLLRERRSALIATAVSGSIPYKSAAKVD